MKKILVVITHRGLGDLIYLLPLLKSLHDSYNTKIDILSNKTNKAQYIYQNENFINSIDTFDLNHKNLIFNVRDKLNYLKKINSYNADLLIVTGRHSSLIIPFHLSNAKHKKMFGLSFFNSKEKESKNLLSSESIFENTKKLKLKKFINNFELNSGNISDKENNIFINLDSHHGQNNWKIKNFLFLVNSIKLNYDNIFINFSPYHKYILNEIPKDFQKIRNVCFTYNFTFPKIIDTIKNCKIILGNESGPICLGLAFKKRVFSIYSEQHTRPESSLIGGEVEYFNSSKMNDNDIIKDILKKI